MAQRVGTAIRSRAYGVFAETALPKNVDINLFIFGDETMVNFLLYLLPCSSKMTSRHITPGVGGWEGCPICTTVPSPTTLSISSHRCTTRPTRQTAPCPSTHLRTPNSSEIRMQYTGRWSGNTPFYLNHQAFMWNTCVLSPVISTGKHSLTKMKIHRQASHYFFGFLKIYRTRTWTWLILSRIYDL